jgi:hypothetical protein
MSSKTEEFLGQGAECGVTLIQRKKLPAGEYQNLSLY